MLIALDYDGVLVDSFEQIEKLVNSTRHLFGIKSPLTMKDLQKLDDLTFESVGRFLGIPEKNLPQFAKQVFNLLRTHLGESKVFAGMPEVVQSLAKEHTLILITSNIKEKVVRVLSKHELMPCIEDIFDGSDPAPKSEKIIRASKQFHVDPNQIVMIGDTASDIKHGKTAGTKTIAVAWGFQTQETLEDANPDYIAKSPNDILSCIQNLQKNLIIP
jgi:phosphoglycolate phosphatase